MLEFIGRAGLVSDLCGEKLTEDFVSTRLVHASGFSMLAPVLTPYPHYVLFLDREECVEAAARDMAEILDVALADNPQYAYARKLGQLGPLRVCRVANPLARYVHQAVARGQRLGEVKPPVLRPEMDWEGCFSDA
jgi:hypothetical protein